MSVQSSVEIHKLDDGSTWISYRVNLGHVEFVFDEKLFIKSRYWRYWENMPIEPLHKQKVNDIYDQQRSC